MLWITPRHKGTKNKEQRTKKKEKRKEKNT